MLKRKGEQEDLFVTHQPVSLVPVRFYNRGPDGVCLPPHPALGADRGAVEWSAGGRDQWTASAGESDESVGESVDKWTATPSWDGEAVDYDAVVSAITSPP